MRFIKVITLLICVLLSVNSGNAQVYMAPYQGAQYRNSAFITTGDVTDIGISTAVSGGAVGGSVGSIVVRGVCWSSTGTPTMASSRSISGYGSGTFGSNLYELASNTTYNLRAYAQNSDGVIYYGETKTFKTLPTTGYLSYKTYAVSTADVKSKSDMDSQISAAGGAFDSGILIGSTAVDYEDYSKLLAGGVKIPNNNDNFIFVASGYLTPSVAGKYTFTCEGDDAVELFLDNMSTPLVSQYNQNSASPLGTHFKQTGDLVKGRAYKFLARMKENAGNEVLRVYWKKPSQSSFGQDISEFTPDAEVSAGPVGKVYYDGMLTYDMFENTPANPNSLGEMNNLFNNTPVASTGLASALTLLNFPNYNALQAAGITVPNNGDAFALSARGFFIPSETGTYTFTCEGDDAVDLAINNNVIVSHYGGHAPSALGTHTGTVYLLKGSKYPIVARMQEAYGGEVLMVYWRKPSQTSGWTQDISEISSTN